MAADAVGVHDFVGGGVAHPAGFVAMDAPAVEEAVDDGVCAGGVGPVDGSVEEGDAFAGVAGVDDVSAGRVGQEAAGAAEAVVFVPNGSAYVKP